MIQECGASVASDLPTPSSTKMGGSFVCIRGGRERCAGAVPVVGWLSEYSGLVGVGGDGVGRGVELQQSYAGPNSSSRSAASPCSTSQSEVSPVKHVVWVWMENHTAAAAVSSAGDAA